VLYEAHQEFKINKVSSSNNSITIININPTISVQLSNRNRSRKDNITKVGVPVAVHPKSKKKERGEEGKRPTIMA